MTASAPDAARNPDRVATACDTLVEALPRGSVRLGVPLATLSRWRIGGPARLVIEPRDQATLSDALIAIAASGLPMVVIGDGSNLLFDDAGFDGVILRVGRAFTGFDMLDATTVKAGAGLWVPCFVRRVIGQGLAGATHAIGIPGTLGGLVVMNGGSQRHGIGEHVVEVTAIDRNGTIARLNQEALAFAYRRSALQESGQIVLDATFRFEPGDGRALHREALAILSDRRRKFPRVRANCGSVFVSDPALYDLIGPPGRAIEVAGLKGASRGGAQWSPQHANFIVNNGGARSADVLALIHLARDKVAEMTGIAMNAEVRHVRPDGTIEPAHLSVRVEKEITQ